MNIRKSDVFLTDVEQQFEWALRGRLVGTSLKDYLAAVRVHLVAFSRNIPSLVRSTTHFNHPRLRAWRFFVISKPFKKHIIFYELDGMLA